MSVQEDSPHDWTEARSEAEQQEELPSFVSLFETPDESVCDFGDVTLVADDGFHPQLRIRVSSCILATASKVFRSLFSTRFAEGQAIRTGQHEVTVKEGPRPMLLLCQLLHHHLSPIALDVSDDWFLDFVLLIDKYDCIDTLRLSLPTLLQHIEETKTVYRDYIRFTIAAYMLDQPVLFRRYSSNIVRHMPSSLFSLDARCKQLLSVGFFDSLEAQRNYVLQHLSLAISDIVDKFCTAAYMNLKPNLIQTLLESLKRERLWPLDFRHIQLGHAATLLLNVSIPILRADEDVHYQAPQYVLVRRDGGWDEPLPATWETMPTSSTPPKPDPVKDLCVPKDGDLRALAKRIEELCVGICLDCLEGKDKCRVEHTRPWHVRNSDDDQLSCDSLARFRSVWEQYGVTYEQPEPPQGWQDLW